MAALLSVLAGGAVMAAEPFAFVPTPSTAAARGVVVTPPLLALRRPHQGLFGCTSMAAEGETMPAPTKDSETAPLFQELIVSNRSSAKVLMGATVAIFNKGEKAADLVLVDADSKHELVKTAAFVPAQFRASAQLLLRRRDRKLRMRLTQNFRPEPDEDPELILVTKTSNATKLGAVLKSRFVDALGDNRGRSVKLKLMGNTAAAITVLAIENAQRSAYRDLAFVARYVEEESDDSTATEGGALATNSKRVSMEIVVTAL